MREGGNACGPREANKTKRMREKQKQMKSWAAEPTISANFFIFVRRKDRTMTLNQRTYINITHLFLSI